MIAFTNKSGDTVPGENAPRAPDVLMAGPVTMHRHGPLLARRRLWMEISTEMITTYPTGDEAGRVRPLQTVLRTS
jgi:sterol 3beta-glucosyltransferase